jgi:hypothetical protein
MGWQEVSRLDLKEFPFVGKAQHVEYKCRCILRTRLFEGYNDSATRGKRGDLESHYEVVVVDDLDRIMSIEFYDELQNALHDYRSMRDLLSE